MRARDIGISFDGKPGALNAITDVSGVKVGMTTVIHDTENPDVCARTGVTAVLPLGQEGIGTSVPAGIFSFNGNGEMTGSHWIQETGGLSSPIMLTNTHAVGTVHRAVIDWMVENHPDKANQWILPVVAETWDGYLNSINQEFISREHVYQAINQATGGAVPEGSVGGGTGMNTYGFKAGHGSSSRLVELGGKNYTVGALVQANFGERSEFQINGKHMGDLDVANPMADTRWLNKGQSVPAGAGSVIVLIATDAPMTPMQCQALARRVPLGLARSGTTGGHFSGDIFLAFSTQNQGALDSTFPDSPSEDVKLQSMSFVPWNWMDPFFTAVVQAVEEAVLNSLVSNKSMTGRSGHLSPALPTDKVLAKLAN
jgi:L-aminopeptidase/D-esterase-like protein